MLRGVAEARRVYRHFTSRELDQQSHLRVTGSVIFLLLLHETILRVDFCFIEYQSAAVLTDRSFLISCVPCEYYTEGKIGYRKLIFCSRQAKIDGLHFI